jgi:hypothetical protein
MEQSPPFSICVRYQSDGSLSQQWNQSQLLEQITTRYIVKVVPNFSDREKGIIFIHDNDPST